MKQCHLSPHAFHYGRHWAFRIIPTRVWLEIYSLHFAVWSYGCWNDSFFIDCFSCERFVVAESFVALDILGNEFRHIAHLIISVHPLRTCCCQKLNIDFGNRLCHQWPHVVILHRYSWSFKQLIYVTSRLRCAIMCCHSLQLVHSSPSVCYGSTVVPGSGWRYFSWASLAAASLECSMPM